MPRTPKPRDPAAPLRAALARVGATHYEFLGVAPGASQEEVDEARRAITRWSHPDRWCGTELVPLAHEVTARANVAHMVLSDAKQRKLYDAMLRKTHRPCSVCEGVGFVLKTRGFKGQVKIDCVDCAGNGYILKETRTS